MRPDQLEELRLLTNSEMASASPLAGFLAGQPTLNRQLRMGMFATLDQPAWPNSFRPGTIAPSPVRPPYAVSWERSSWASCPSANRTITVACPPTASR